MLLAVRHPDLHRDTGQRRVEQRRGRAGGPDEPPVQTSEPRGGRCGRDRGGVLGVVDVAHHGQDSHPQAEALEADELVASGPRGRHRHAPDGVRHMPAEADRPVPAVARRSEYRVVVAPRHIEVGGKQVRRVHPDQQHAGRAALGRVHVLEHVLQSLVERRTPLRQNAYRRWQPRHWRAVPRDHGPPWPELAHRVERVADGRGRQGSGLGAAERRLQPGLDPTGDR